MRFYGALTTFSLLLTWLSSSAAVGIYTRSVWTKRPLMGVPHLRDPVPYVLIHHTATPECQGIAQCGQRLRSIQAGHLRRRFPDIGYNFLISSDGGIYEGVGYGRRGAHAPGYNSKSYGIAFIGNFDIRQPSPRMLHAARQLIGYMSRTGRLRFNYKILGHRETKSTTCPGQRLYAEIRKWPNWGGCNK